MKEFVISEAKAETAVLVGLITKEQNEAKTKEYLDELEFLADTAGAVTVKRFTQKVGGPSQTTYVGSGKLLEIKEYIKQCQDEYDDWMDRQDGSPLPSANHFTVSVSPFQYHISTKKENSMHFFMILTNSCIIHKTGL